MLRQATGWFAARGVTARRVLTDNGGCYHSRDWAMSCAELGVNPKRTWPYRPQTNGKVERFKRTVGSEWAFAQSFIGEAARRTAFPDWLHLYNHHQPTPASEVIHLSAA
ncbi:integrase-like protein [Geodermatophilus tzadiensis]|uniref:Integrase-like protein n=1 Tax=Geodermatophilus tzadiensis TaxID=1137988 RepID=A0A2T0TRW6_9ACTN|nr:integrase-like protein [Geodermatophilus tzadiensis]